MAKYVHKIVQGENLMTLVNKYKVRPETILNDADNEKLKKLRGEKLTILMPGDVVIIHKIEKMVEAQSAVHKSVVKGSPKVYFKTYLLTPKNDEELDIENKIHDERDKPLINVKCLLIIDDKIDEAIEGTTDNEGFLCQEVKLDTKNIKIVAELPKNGKSSVDAAVTYNFDINKLDPIDEISGFQQRLVNLGFFNGKPTGKYDDKTKEAIKAFQMAYKLDINEDMQKFFTEKYESKDNHQSATKDKLEEVYGS